MTKLLLSLLCIALMAMFGCVLVDYWPIMDSDQINAPDKGQCSCGMCKPYQVNTNGKAHVMEPVLHMQIFCDHSEEVLWFIDQNPAANRITTYNYTNYECLANWDWHDDYYCNPDWNGCSWVTATREMDYIDEIYPFDVNWSCTEITMGYLFAGWRYGECGRTLPLADKIALLEMGEIGMCNDEEGLYYDFNRANFSITLENQYGQTFNVPIYTDIIVFLNPFSRHFAIDRTNPLMGNMMKWYADWLDTYATDTTLVHISYMGINDSFTIAGKKGFSSDLYRGAANKLY